MLRRALCAGLAVCMIVVALSAATHAHPSADRRPCTLCMAAQTFDRCAPPPPIAPPAPSLRSPVGTPVARVGRTCDVLAYSPKNSPPSRPTLERV